MALPVTITGLATTFAPVGPFFANGAYYLFGRDGTTATTLRAFKATDPSTAWTAGATATGFTTAILGLAGYQVGNTIYLALYDGTSPTLVATKFVTYNATTDTFGTVETVKAAASLISAPTTLGLVVRSNGEAVVLFSGVGIKVTSTTYARVYHTRRTAVNTWSAAVEVDSNAQSNMTAPVAVLGQSDRVHFVWSVGGGSVGYRTLSAANALNTGATSTSMTTPADGCGYDRAGTFKVVFSGFGSGQATMYFNSADNPTPTFANQGIANARDPHRIGSDSFDNSVTIVYSNSADSDLYAIKSTDDGATFGAPVSLFVGTVGATDLTMSRSASGSIYDRGTSTVVGYVVNDGGTWKYNEYVLRQAGTAGTGALAAGTSTAVGVGVATIRGTAALSAAISTAAGVGVSRSLGTSVLAAGVSTVAGTGTAMTPAVGTGVLAAVAASLVEGYGTVTDAATGTIIYYYDPTRVTRSNGNITVVNNATDLNPSTVISQSTRGATKVYAELSIDANARNFMFVGVGLTTELLDQYTGTSATAYGWVNVSLIHNGSTIATGMPAHHTGDTVALAVDRIAHTLRVRNVTTNSVWSDPVDISDIAANDLCFVATFDRVNDQYTFNFDGAFAGLPPGLGYTRWDGTAFSYSFPEVTGTGALQAVPVSRINYVPYSQSLDLWGTSFTTVTADVTSAAAPDGTNTAEMLTDTTDDNIHGIYSTLTPNLPSDAYTFSIYVRGDQLSWVKLYVSAAATVWANFNVTTGAKGLDSGGGVTSSITFAGNGWYRCSITVTSALPTVYVYLITLPSDQPELTYPGAGASTFAWGGQLERGTAPTAYVPTGASAVTFFDPPLSGAGTVGAAGVTGTGALISGAAAGNNLIWWSQDFENVWWTKYHSTLAANNTQAPDGTSTADTLTTTTGTNLHALLGQLITVGPGTYTQSIYAKAGTCHILEIQIPNCYGQFDLVNGVVFLSVPAGSVISDAGNGWWRCSVTGTYADPTRNIQPTYTLTDDTGSEVFDAVVSLSLWGAQLEPGAVGPYAATQAGPAVGGALLVGVGTVIDGISNITGNGALAASVVALASAGAIFKTFFNPLMSSASFTFANSNLTVERAVATSKYLLETITTQPTGAYSMRRISPTATTYSLQLTDAYGAITTSIGWNGDEIDLAAVDTFYSTTSGNTTANVRGWYDQSGSNHHLLNGLGSVVLRFGNYQGGVLQTINGHPAANFCVDAGRSVLKSTDVYLQDLITATAYTVISTYMGTDTFTVAQVEHGFLGDGGNGYFGSTEFLDQSGVGVVNYSYFYDGRDRIVTKAASVNVPYVVITQLQAGVLKLWVNGGTAVTLGGNNPVQVLNYAPVQIGAGGANLKCIDVLVYNTALSAADLNALATASGVIGGNLVERIGATWTTLV